MVAGSWRRMLREVQRRWEDGDRETQGLVTAYLYGLGAVGIEDGNFIGWAHFCS